MAGFSCTNSPEERAQTSGHFAYGSATKQGGETRSPGPGNSNEHTWGVWRERAEHYATSVTQGRNTVAGDRDRPQPPSAEFFGEPDKNALRPADVAEPIRVFPDDDSPANKYSQSLAHGQRLIAVMSQRQWLR